jgi:hypothetical protein
MRLRCGNCGHVRELVLGDAAAEELERILDRGVEEICRTLARIERERMEREADAWAVALQRDLIDASDFG